MQNLFGDHKKTLYLIDGYGFVFRAYHSMPPLTTSDGTPVGAIYGFTNMLIKIIDKISNSDKENYVCVALDSGKKTFRTDIYSEYKANRPSPPDDLRVQFPLVREVADALCIKQIEVMNYEADDIIATLAKKAEAEGIKVVIVSSDKDLMQLVNENIMMYDPVRNKPIGEKEVVEKFGVTPKQVCDLLTLTGDSSDNIPGVPGVGPKTAADLLNMFGSLDAMLANLEGISPKKKAQAIKDNIPNIELSKKLVSLEYNTPLEVGFADLLLCKPDDAKLIEFLRKYQFTSMLNKALQKAGAPPVSAEVKIPQAAAVKNPDAKKVNHKTFTKLQEFHSWVQANKIEKNIFLFLSEENEKTKLEVGIKTQHSIETCSFELGAGGSGQLGFDLYDNANNADELTYAKVYELLQQYINNPAIAVVGHDIKELSLKFFRHCDFKIAAYEDVMMMSYLIDNVKHGHDFASICLAFLETDGGAEKIPALVELYDLLKQRMVEAQVTTLYWKIENPLIQVLIDTEKTGVKIDMEELKKTSEDFATEIKRIEAEVYQLCGEEFNIGSPKQMGHVLFEKLGIQGGKKSKKTGAYSTSSDILDKLSLEGHVVADKILEWRHYSKLKSTYTDSLQKQVNPKTKRVHTTFSMALTSTGRLSSYNPNLQNIPIRSEEGKRIRKAFVSEPGKLLISADYSQIELRLLAHIADIKSLKDAFAENKDIHKITAMNVFGLSEEQVTSEIRRRAKTINFGIIYGQTAFGLAKQLGIGNHEADGYIKEYFRRYPGIHEYMQGAREEAREFGYVKSLFGRRCYITEINSKLPALRNFAERAAINAPLQGTAADITKKAMVGIHNYLTTNNIRANITLQVHDEILIEADMDIAEELSLKIKAIMEDAAHLSVPLTVEVGVGKNWDEIH